MGQGATASSLTAINGAVLIDDTAAHTGAFMAIQAVGGAAAVIANSGTTSNIDDFADTTIDSGQTIYGRFSQITLSSGKVIAYKR
jgi:hypothetical protein